MTKSSALVDGEVGVEVEHQHRVGAGMGEQFLPLVEAGQAERREVGLEEAHRMRVEGRDDHRPPLVMAAGDRSADHRLVAQVEAVEIAERDDCAAEAIGYGLVEGQPLHCAGAVSGAPPLGNLQGHGCLNSSAHEFLFATHPDQPVPGGAFVRASVFRLERGNHSAEMGRIAAPWS